MRPPLFLCRAKAQVAKVKEKKELAKAQVIRKQAKETAQRGKQRKKEMQKPLQKQKQSKRVKVAEGISTAQRKSLRLCKEQFPKCSIVCTIPPCTITCNKSCRISTRKTIAEVLWQVIAEYSIQEPAVERTIVSLTECQLSTAQTLMVLCTSISLSTGLAHFVLPKQKLTLCFGCLPGTGRQPELPCRFRWAPGSGAGR